MVTDEDREIMESLERENTFFRAVADKHGTAFPIATEE